MNPRDARWDRSADLEAIRRTYRRYDDTDRGRLWDEGSRGYARLVTDLEARLLASLSASIPPGGGTVLDLGCGDGALARVRDRLIATPKWVGVDLRPEAVEAASARFPDARFMTASADELPLDDASIDVVVARVLFSSLPSARLEEGVAAEVHRVLRPDGWLVWLDIRYSNPSNPAVHGLPMRRVSGLFPGWPRELSTAGLLPPLARRLGLTAPVAYPLLSALPILRSHLVGRLRRPAADA